MCLGCQITLLNKSACQFTFINSTKLIIIEHPLLMPSKRACDEAHRFLTRIILHPLLIGLQSSKFLCLRRGARNRPIRRLHLALRPALTHPHTLSLETERRESEKTEKTSQRGRLLLCYSPLVK